MKKFIFFTSEAEASSQEFHSFFLNRNNWDDYNHRTTFEMCYVCDNRTLEYIGKVKITKVPLDEADYSSHHIYKAQLNSKFNKLEDNYVSLGQSDSYYKNLKQYLSPDETDEFLSLMNDLSACKNLYQKYKNETVISNSLLRTSQAERLLTIGHKLALSLDIEDNYFSFRYTKKLQKAASPHILDAKFPNSDNIPFRINLIIGKNGTGKTQILVSLIKSLVGDDIKADKDAFHPHRPFFTSIIAISYSIFDEFPVPANSKYLTYKYIGLRRYDNVRKTKESKEIDLDQPTSITTDGIKMDKALENKITNALKEITEKDREPIWKGSISSLLNAEKLGIKQDNDNDMFYIHDEEQKSILKNRKNLSSGENIILLIITELIANIEENSLVLLDEPESHLHPNMMVRLIRVIHNILDRYKSYAIIATHSPIILQEIPSKFVHIFEREGNVPSILALEQESFGESLSNLTRMVFETSEIEEGYKIVLQQLLKKNTVKEVSGFFNNNLPLNAMLYLAAKKQ
ncbi:AAA family ATPase [uncultured Alistipes sp.]|uniref:AAA family ATPase n=1 Tax=uncultured Alistipes sp. TaxID=538949 RepID=UPI00266EEF36|nr:AAA family ATPase [uncultured Alistipes sp.]